MNTNESFYNNKSGLVRNNSAYTLKNNSSVNFAPYVPQVPQHIDMNQIKNEQFKTGMKRNSSSKKVGISMATNKDKENRSIVFR